MSVAHEEGYQKLLYLLGPGIVYPGCHLSDFRIERVIEAIAITDIVALRFDRTVFRNAAMCIVELRQSHVRITDERSSVKICSYETLLL